MPNLTLTTDTIALITSDASTIDVRASWVDDLADAFTAGKQNTAITTATTTDIVSSPAGSTVRNVKTISIRNKDATLSNTVTVHFNANGTLYQIISVPLLVGEALILADGQWTRFNASGVAYTNAVSANPVDV